jgi:hypothetical protein
VVLEINKGVEMNDETIAERIERLVTEENELRAQGARDSEHPYVLEIVPIRFDATGAA